MNDGNIADKLRKPRWRPSRETVLGTVASVAFLAVAGTGVWALTSTGQSSYVESPARSIGAPVVQVEPTEPAVAPAVAHDDSWGVTLPAPENYYGHDGPVQCPAGTVANAVDAYGNESACQPTNGAGQQCVAYDANNNCTQWYKP